MRVSRRSKGSRLGLRSAALAAGLSLFMSGCFYEVAENHKAVSPNTRPYYCNATGDGTPIGGHGNGSHVAPIYEGMEKGKLSWDDCFQLGRELDEVTAAVSDVLIRSAGEAAGWREVAEYIPGLGTHHAKGFFGGGDGPPTGDDGDDSGDDGGDGDGPPTFDLPPFDPAEPTFLIYGGEGPNAPLVGMAYAAPGTSDPPEAFAGNNDWWHLHQKICIGPDREILAGAEEIPDEECEALGGRQIALGPGIWLLHVWIVPHYQFQPDVFASGHPCLGEGGPLPWEDPCWELANRNPALGLPPGTEPDDHDDHG